MGESAECLREGGREEAREGGRKGGRERGIIQESDKKETKEEGNMKMKMIMVYAWELG